MRGARVRFAVVEFPPPSNRSHLLLHCNELAQRLNVCFEAVEHKLCYFKVSRTDGFDSRCVKLIEQDRKICDLAGCV